MHHEQMSEVDSGPVRTCMVFRPTGGGFSG